MVQSCAEKISIQKPIRFISEYLSLDEIFSELEHKFCLSKEKIEEIKQVIEVYPLKISRYYWNLIKSVDDPIWKQCIPNIAEIRDQVGEEDPLAEERDSPAPLITHRYPDRCLFLISDTCEMYCRFCTRKRKMGTEKLVINLEKIDVAIEYIRNHHEIRDVILSGGDALCAPINMIKYILKKLREIAHVEIIRLGSRVPCTNPQRITQELCDLLKQFHPIYINVHFEHPNEITPESIKACEMLANAGIPLGNQNVLLKGINDDPTIMGELYKGLLKMRVKPYYLFQADFVKGTNHFRTNVETGINIIHGIRGFISGLAIPHYVIDAPNGGGKIPIIPDYLKSLDEEKVILENYAGKKCEYLQVQ
ncbi:MAG: KamA family radical SAM protein [Candidatus Lokiarchaeota archaeon]|nr:KamA family radical SAM protein [Candidatus Lokiarchaeota archaeon]